MTKDVGNAKVLLSKQLKHSENILTMLLGINYSKKESLININFLNANMKILLFYHTSYVKQTILAN